MKLQYILLLIVIIRRSEQIQNVAIFHGLGDACVIESVTGFPKFIKDQLEQEGEQVYVKCIESGASIFSIVLKSFEQQAEDACTKLKEDSNFANQNITVIGLSQGALIARYIAQKCEFNGLVTNLVSIGGPNMGVAAIPHCSYQSNICSLINRFLGNYLVYNYFVQQYVGPAGYYRDTFNLDQYYQDSNFLAALNNEKDFDQQNTMITPKETAWFQSYIPGTLNVQEMEQTDLYQQDLIGLQYLDSQSKIQKYSVEADHLQISEEELIKYVIKNIS